MSTLVSLEQAHFVRDAGLGAILGGHTSPPYFVLELDGTYQCWRVKNGTPTRISSNADFDERTDPRLSPDGTKIVYNRRRTGLWDVRCLAEDGSSDVLTFASGTSGFGDAGPASWHPDGLRVVFKASSSFVLKNADGSGPISTVLNVSSGQKPKYLSADFLGFQAILPAPLGNGNPGLFVLDIINGPILQRGVNLRTIAGGFDWSPLFDETGTRFAWGDGISAGVNGNWRMNTTGGFGLKTLNATAPAAVDQVICTFQASIQDPAFGVEGWVYAFRFVAAYTLFRYRIGGVAFEENLGHVTTGQVGLGPVTYEDRVWFMTRTPGVLYSCAADGTDLTVEHTLSDNGVGDDFYLGTGFNSNRNA